MTLWNIPLGRRTKLYPVKYEQDGKTLYVYSSWDRDALEEFRAMEGSQWDKDRKAWKIPITERNGYAINFLENGPDPNYYDNHLLEHYIQEAEQYDMYSWQKEAFAFILAKKRVFIAYKMGLGKTLTVIRVMDYLKDFDVINWWLVAPYGAQKSWERELKKWNAKQSFTVVTTYESLHKYLEAATMPPQGVIFDESIKIKNPQSQRSQIAYELCRLMREYSSSSFIVELSGAPSAKEQTDWWHQIEVLQPGFIREGNVHKLRNRLATIEYEEGEYGQYPVIKDWKEDEIQAFGRRLKPIVLSRRKEDCLELPEKIFDVILCSPSEDTLRVAQALVSTASSGIEALEKLRELSDGFQYTKETSQKNVKSYDWVGSPKLDIILELLDFYSVDNGGCGRLVVYAWFQATVAKLREFIGEHAVNVVSSWKCHALIGDWNAKILEDFETYDGNLCLVANPARVHGLNLQRTECLVYYSNSFSPDHRVQSLDRRDRPGMDTTKGTRVVDIIHLDTDKLILDRVSEGMRLEEITLEEINKCLNL